METQHPREMDKNRDMEKKETARSGSDAMASSAMSTADGGNQGGGTMEQAKSMARNVGEQARNMASDAGATAQDLARRAREQTSAATDSLYEQGNRAGEYLTRNVNEYPLTALLIAGAIGYGLGYLIHSSWAGQSWMPQSRTDGDRSDRNSGGRRRD